MGSGIGRMRYLIREADLTEPEFNTEGTIRRPFDFNK